MNLKGVLAAYDEQVRLHPERAGAGVQVEREHAIVRVVSSEDGWIGVTWSDLDADTANAVIDNQIHRFASLGVRPKTSPGKRVMAAPLGQISDTKLGRLRPVQKSGLSAELLARAWEWKHYSYDRPLDLPERLLKVGFTRQPTETLLVALTAELELAVAPPPGVRLLPVVDAWGVDALVRVHDEVFGGDHSATGRALAAQLHQQPQTIAAVVAVAGQTPIAAGRVELTRGTEFASLWGGGTLPAWRGRGVFRSLVAYRAGLASAAGCRYLQVDASAESRPILERLGFVELATTTPFVYSASWPVSTSKGERQNW